MSHEQVVAAKNELISDQNLSRFDIYTTEQGLADALTIYQSSFAGDLATIVRPERELEGYPMGSVVPFMLDHTGSPVILTAQMAEHSKNAQANSHASLLVRDVTRNHMIETGWRLTIIGDLIDVPENELARVAKRYENFYPHAVNYKKVHHFIYMRLVPKKFRLIKTFGQIKWLDVDTIATSSPFSEEQEDRILAHMNSEHPQAIRHYLSGVLGLSVAEHKEISMVGLNQFGATIRYGKRLAYLPFAEPINTVEAVRAELVRLAKQ
ncbi:hypothetical protein AAEX37_01863 [Oligella sp. MSHR50489EDL]